MPDDVLALAERKPFNPDDPFDAMAETIRRDISDVGLRALATTIYRDLPTEKQIECFAAGALSGVVGVLFSHVKPQGHNAIIEYLTACLPLAREIVDDIARSQQPDQKREGE